MPSQRRTQQHSLGAEAAATYSPLAWRSFVAEPSSAERARRTLQDFPLKGLPGQQAVPSGTVIVLGTGAVGGDALCLLARSGVGTVYCVDPDCYGPESFLTQPVNSDESGQPKAWVQAARAHAANPWPQIHAAVGYAQDLPLAVLRQADVLVVTGDNLELALWAGRMAMALGKPLIEGAVHGELAMAVVRSYMLRDPQAACPQCGTSLGELLRQKSRHGCDPQQLRRNGQQPTRTMPVVCQLAGELAAGEALKWLAGQDQLALRGEEYAHSLLTHRGWRTRLPRSQRCRLAHRRWQLTDMTSSHAEVTPRMLAAEVGLCGEPGLLQVRSELPWISYVFCLACQRSVSVRRFAPLGVVVGGCDCGARLEAGPQGSYSVIPAEDLRLCWDDSFQQLGLTNHESVGLLADDDWVYFFPPSTSPQVWRSEIQEELP